jgi:Protein of unknown function (DUF3298)
MLKIIMSFFKTDYMSKNKFYTFIILILGLNACKNESKPTENNTVSSPMTTATTTPTTSESVAPNGSAEIEHKEISRRQVDANGKNMVAAGYVIKYPSVKKGSAALTESVKKWSHTFISEQIGFGRVIDPELGYELYVAMFRQAAASNKNLKEWDVSIKDNIMYNMPKIISLRIDATTSFVATSINRATALSSFDPQTGEILSLDKLVIDQAAMLALCEKNLRTVKTDIFKDGFKFTKEGPFRLPKNFAITPSGVLFHYNPHEIAPKVLGDAEFTIPFTELEKMMDLKKYL